MSIIRLAVNRPVTTMMTCLAVVLFGLFSANRLAIDLTPEISLPSLTVSTSYSGVAPEEIETLITIPIEQTLSTVPGVTGLESLSQEGSSRVTLRFAWGTDLEAAANEVRANLDRVRNRLPDDASAPRVFRFDPSQFPIMTLGVAGDLDVADLRHIAEDEILYHLERIEGVASVTLQGGGTREIRVALDPHRLQAHGLTLDQVVNALRAENMNAPAGRISLGEAQFSLRTLGRIDSVEELPHVLVAYRDGIPTYLRDIADVEPASQDEGVRVRVDERPGVVMSIQKQPGSNTVQVADAIMRTVEELRREHPELTIRPVSDTSVFIRSAVNNVVRAGVVGGLLAALMLLIFLRDVRSTVIIAVAMPVSIIASFILIERAGMTLNVMSLGGLALGVGMLLDNSIVVLENIFRHRSMGKSAQEASIDGTEEMATAILAATLTTLAVFLPLMFVTGMSGILFRQLSLMVAFSVGCSLFVALTILPVMSAKLLKDDPTQSSLGANQGAVASRLATWSARIGRFLDGLEEAYRSVLARWIHRPGWVAGGAAVLFGASLLLVPYLGSELLPPGDEGELSIAIALPPGTRIDITDEVTTRVERLVRQHVPEMQALDTRVGSGSFGGRGPHSATVNVTLAPASQRARTTDEVAAALREVLLESLPGINTRVSVRSNFAARLASGSFGGGGGDRISLSVLGHDLGTLQRAAEDIEQVMASLPSVTGTRIARDESQPEFVLRVDRERVADVGLSTAQIAQAVQSAVQGRVATQLTLDGQDYGVRVLIARDGMTRDDFLTPGDVEALPIPVGNGAYVPLGTVARLVQQDTPAAIQRLDRQRSITITASPVGDLGGSIADIRSAIDEYGLPDGVNVRFGGEYEEQQRAFRELLVVVLLAVVLVYVVMAAQFESLFDPLIIMFSVPFALVGVIWTLALTGTPVTTQAFMGLIMLGGIAVNNAIVLVTYIKILLERDMSLDEAVLEGSATRLRPIFMTTGTTVLALLPLAMEFGEGSEIQSPLARAVIGGLLVSTFVTLVLIPTIYHWAYARRARRREARVSMTAADPAGVPTASARSLSSWLLGIALGIAVWTLMSMPVLAGPALEAQQSGAPGSEATAPSRDISASTAERKGTDPVTALTLEEALALARSVHPDVRRARRAYEAAESQLREERAAYQPRLDVEADWGLEWAEGASGESRRCQGTQAAVRARQVIATGPFLGRPSLPVERAKTAREIAEREWRDAEDAAILDVMALYLGVLEAEEAVRVGEMALARADDALREVHIRRDAGMADELDVREVETRRAAAQLSLEVAQERVAVAEARLRSALGLPAGAALRLRAPDVAALLPDSLAHPLELSLDWDDVFARRLDVVKARIQLEQAQREAEWRVSGRAPRVDVSAGVGGEVGRVSLGWESDDRNTSLSVAAPLTSSSGEWTAPSSRRISRETGWDVHVGITWPLWDGGVDREKLEQQEIQIAQLADELARLEEAAALDVREAWWAQLEAQRRAALAELERELAAERLQRVERRYEAGVETISDVLDAHLALFQAERSLLEARYDALLAGARYRRAVGDVPWPSG